MIILINAKAKKIVLTLKSLFGEEMSPEVIVSVNSSQYNAVKNVI